MSATDRVTYAQAAEILGCHVSNVPKLVARGLLVSERRRDGALARADVEALAARRAAARAIAGRRRRPIDRWPDLEHVWLKPAQVAVLLDVSEQGVTKLLRRGRLPGRAVGSRWWVRQDQLEHAVDARLASWTRQP